MGRWMQISVLGAVVVGGGGGSIAALLVTPASSGGSSAAPASAAPASAAPAIDERGRSSRGIGLGSGAEANGARGSDSPRAGSAPVITELPPEPVAPDPVRLLTASMATVLTRAAAWARDHAGAPCPDLAALEVTATDPWGHPLQLTCAAQPDDQMMGAISAGPDGIPGNSDDVASWQLGPEVTEPVRGARWAQGKANARPKPPRHHRDGTAATDSIGPVTHPPGFMSTVRPPSAPPADAGSAAPTTVAPPPDAGGDDIPAHRSRR
jgi:hypothetical protein